MSPALNSIDYRLLIIDDWKTGDTRYPNNPLSFINHQLFRPGKWFWAAIFIGIAIRIYLVICTYGTQDVTIWQEHASGIQKFGLIGYYHANPLMNHPPFAGMFIFWLLKVAEITGIPFRILLRLPFLLLDAGTAIVLLLALKKSPYRFILTICYWLCPMTIIFSAYHGNTDSSVAFFLMLCFYLVINDRIIWAAVALGISLWFKTPGILTIPAFLFFLKNWRERFRFILIAGLTGISTYLPAVLFDPAIVFKNVFTYRGQLIHTTSGIPIWGIRIFIIRLLSLLGPQWQLKLSRPVMFYAENNTLICAAAVVFYSFLRRNKKKAGDLGKTIAGIYAILYGLSSYWSFQYFAWSIPFWFFAGAIFAVPSLILASLYIYGLYWWVCGNPWLLGTWDFIGHPYWPQFLINIRDLTVLFFLASALVFLFCEIKAQLSVLSARIRQRKTKCGTN